MFKKFRSWFQHEDAHIDIKFENQNAQINGHQFQLTRADTDDVDEMLRLEQSVYDGQTPWDRMAFLSELRKRELSLYLVLWDEQKLVAFIGCWFTKRESHITNIAVAPQYQGQGVGKYLMQFMIDMAISFDSQAMTLEVRTTNVIAKGLYHKLGFEDGPVKRGYYVMDHSDAMEMRKALNEILPVEERNQ
ncbi:ribosomal protein S18-alanine N-acetyltransferase [Agrilactobacillus fermenti]|uniref:ribosomal protein S18-alanine N-acetyltransferase n=1 Tax=Agrilactobacillus fermenti TaxID=2586909 RepID=UPI001E4D528E|nr:ribosomal protein S18-alanine N-acetyltransferase [Agrilactobacillus fermenti]MCD2257504.1 ribosomal protein S18-alanine N-acetyltransferase [Agrilactobacillus fermenti]